MKTTLGLLLIATLSTQAAVVQFDLSPSGTDAAVGLSPSNQVPPAVGSTGSGNEISAGISFDTDSLKLSLAVGYGSSAGFTDLSGPAIAMHIHGPAGPGTNATVLFDLSGLNFTAPNPTNGGVIFGTVTIPTNAVADLLAGSDYINIHSTAFPNGEIRGQLIPVAATNAAPSISCPPESTVVCGLPSTVTVLVSDPDGDALTVVWTVNGTGIQTNSLPASNPPVAQNVSLTTSLPFGTNLIGVIVMDSATNATSCGTTVVVVDVTPPVITKVTANPSVIWPPNHQMVEVRVSALVTDECTATTWKIVSVSSNEPVDGKGDGHTSPDWQICADHKVKLRAERSGKGSGRVYTITIQATDGGGNVSAPATVTVTVPHDKGNGHGNDQGDAQGNGSDNSNNGNGNGKDNGKGNGKGNGK